MRVSGRLALRRQERAPNCRRRPGGQPDPATLRADARALSTTAPGEASRGRRSPLAGSRLLLSVTLCARKSSWEPPTRYRLRANCTLPIEVNVALVRADVARVEHDGASRTRSASAEHGSPVQARAVSQRTPRGWK